MRGLQARAGQVNNDIARITTDRAVLVKIARAISDVIGIDRDERKLHEAAAHAHGSNPRVIVVWVPEIEGWAEITTATR